MNLFILSLKFIECAEFMFDKHISKMILESAQMLCTAFRICMGIGLTDTFIMEDSASADAGTSTSTNIKLYKGTHLNHPVTIWIRTNIANYLWTLDMVDAMHAEWKWRYNHPPEKQHKAYLICLWLRRHLPPADSFVNPQGGLTPFAQAMPDCYKETPEDDDTGEAAVKAYRAYYQSPDKQRIASWKKRGPPAWYTITGA
jgi:hypothetical protein